MKDISFLDLAKQLVEIREFYLQYETDESVKRKAALREIIHEMNACGIESTLLVSGSLSMGMSFMEPGDESDIEVVYVGDVSCFNSGFFNYSSPQDFFQERSREKLEYTVNISILYYLDLPRIRIDIEHPSIVSQEIIDLYKTYLTCSPLDEQLKPLIDRIDCLMIKNSFYRSMIYTQMIYTQISKPACKPALIGETWGFSFAKYHRRLNMRGIVVPQEQLEKEWNFLDAKGEAKFWRALNSNEDAMKMWISQMDM